jgi:hypothetical protein
MPGGVSHLEGETRQRKDFGIDQIGPDLRRRPITRRARSKEPLQLASRLEGQVIVFGVNVDSRSTSTLKRTGTSHVIDVPVSQ